MARMKPERRVHIEVEVRRLIEDLEMQQHLVAEQLGIDRTTVQRICYRLGIKTQRTGPRAGELHPNWKGGRVLRKGYVQIYSPEHPMRTKLGYVSEHRLVMEKKLGRHLLKSEVVHHIDGDTLNNHPDNLGLFSSNAEHLKHELKGRVPKWTKEGLERIVEGVRKSNEARRGKSMRRKPSCDENQPQ